jgi:hypothetical protein
MSRSLATLTVKSPHNLVRLPINIKATVGNLVHQPKNEVIKVLNIIQMNRTAHDGCSVFFVFFRA